MIVYNHAAVDADDKVKPGLNAELEVGVAQDLKAKCAVGRLPLRLRIAIEAGYEAIESVEHGYSALVMRKWVGRRDEEGLVQGRAGMLSGRFTEGRCDVVEIGKNEATLSSKLPAPKIHLYLELRKGGAGPSSRTRGGANGMSPGTTCTVCVGHIYTSYFSEDKDLSRLHIYIIDWELQPCKDRIILSGAKGETSHAAL